MITRSRKTQILIVLTLLAFAPILIMLWRNGFLPSRLLEWSYFWRKLFVLAQPLLLMVMTFFLFKKKWHLKHGIITLIAWAQIEQIVDLRKIQTQLGDFRLRWDSPQLLHEEAKAHPNSSIKKISFFYYLRETYPTGTLMEAPEALKPLSYYFQKVARFEVHFVSEGSFREQPRFSSSKLFDTSLGKIHVPTQVFQTPKLKLYPFPEGYRLGVQP